MLQSLIESFPLAKMNKIIFVGTLTSMKEIGFKTIFNVLISLLDSIQRI